MSKVIQMKREDALHEVCMSLFLDNFNEHRKQGVFLYSKLSEEERAKYREQATKVVDNGGVIVAHARVAIKVADVPKPTLQEAEVNAVIQHWKTNSVIPLGQLLVNHFHLGLLKTMGMGIPVYEMCQLDGQQALHMLHQHFDMV